MRIDMFVYNRCTSDARVLKEARTLADAGHQVRIVAVLDQTTAQEEERDGFRIVRIDRNPLHYRVLGGARAAGRLWRRPLRTFWAQRNARQGTGGGDVKLGGTRPGPKALLGAAFRLVWGVGGKTTRPFKRAARRLLLIPHKPLMFFDFYWRTYRLVRAEPPEALHAHDLNTLPVAAALARRLRLPLTYDAHELYPEISTLSEREAATWRFLERRLVGRADHVLTVCDSIAAELERRYRTRRPTVLLNCPVGGGSNGLPSEKETQSFGGQADEPIVLYQGGFSPHRGLDTLVRSAHGLERGRIVLMGWGRLEDELRELIAREGLDERVTIVPPVPQTHVVSSAAGATIGVIPYEPIGLNNTYTTPNKLFDYMAAGLPIVASRLPELIRFVEQGEMGVAFTPGDATALAAALNEVLADPERYALMRERSREAGRRYTWERESPKLLALYEGR